MLKALFPLLATGIVAFPAVYEDGCGTATDADGDGVSDTTDCNDNDPTTYPGALELCDGLDNDCDGIDDDADDDGFLACADDCDDTNATTYPGAPEVCGDIDKNCADDSLVFTGPSMWSNGTGPSPVALYTDGGCTCPANTTEDWGTFAFIVYNEEKDGGWSCFKQMSLTAATDPITGWLATDYCTTEILSGMPMAEGIACWLPESLGRAQQKQHAIAWAFWEAAQELEAEEEAELTLDFEELE